MNYTMSSTFRYSNKSASIHKPIQHILIVEDDKVDLKILKANLLNTEFSQCQVSVAGSSAEARAILSNEDIDLILLDLFLIDTYGLNTISSLGNFVRTITTIVISCLSDKNHALEALRYGAQDYILKGDLNAGILSKSIFYAKERQYLIEKNKHAELNFLKELEEERERVAMDLHDGLGQTLTALKYRISGLNHNDQASFHSDVNDIESILQKAIVETRKISTEIMPAILHENGLKEAIERFCYQYSGGDKTLFDIDIDDKLTATDHYTISNLYRIIQESVNNSIKHSKATSIKIKLKSENNILRCQVSDNGLGFDLDEHTSGNGIKNMQKRCAFIGAEFNITTNPDGGTTTSIEMPSISFIKADAKHEWN